MNQILSVIQGVPIVGLFNKTEEEQRAAATAKAAKQVEREAAAFQASPVGQARTAFEQGDRLFQADFEVMEQSAEVVAMMGSFNTRKANTPTAVLNAIVSEGWELITGSFVFVIGVVHAPWAQELVGQFKLDPRYVDDPQYSELISAPPEDERELYRRTTEALAVAGLDFTPETEARCARRLGRIREDEHDE